jgi:hypothetical protein
MVRHLSEPPADLPPIEDLINGPPDTLIGMPVEWRSVPAPEPVFLRTFGPDVMLFGARYPMSEVLMDGEPFASDGHVLEYYLLDRGKDGHWTLHRLHQRGSPGTVAYAEVDDSAEDIPAIDIEDVAALSVGSAPAWNATEASWPTYRGSPMRFVGQIHLPETDVTRDWLAWGQTVYVFATEGPDQAHYKIFMQQTSAQTAEQHYALEDELERRSKSAEANGA